jgi:hypothetical protein
MAEDISLRFDTQLFAHESLHGQMRVMTEVYRTLQQTICLTATNGTTAQSLSTCTGR